MPVLNYFVRCFYIALISVLSFTGLNAQTTIPAGDVSGNWMKNGSPFIVTGSITIPQNQKLVIEPGVEIHFSGNYGLYINGSIHAVGTASDSITFTVTDNSGFNSNTHVGWKGIRFQNVQHEDSSRLVYTVIEYGKISGYGDEGNGGAIFSRSFSRINLSHSTLRNNQAQYGGAVALVDVENVRFKNLIFRANSASENGGAIISTNSTLEIDNCWIVNNKAAYGGGGVYVYQSLLNIKKSLIIGNTGGAIKAHWLNKVNINNSTVAGNTGAPDGFDFYRSDLHCKNSILWNKTYNNTYSEIHAVDYSKVTLEYCIVKGTMDDEWQVSNSVTQDPQFVDLASKDVNLRWENYPEKDASKSPAIDAGDPLGPLDPDGTIQDIGALPYMQTSDAYPTVSFAADTTRGGQPLTINFTNYTTQAAGNIVAWHWDFGDDNTSDQKNPTHVYEKSGVYQVTLTATNHAGKEATITKKDYVTVLAGTIVSTDVVEGVWTKENSPYNIYNDITIPSGKTLSIEPGVEVVFFGHYKLNVKGSLKAKGTENNNIVFTRFNENTSWHSIRIEDVSNDNDSTILEHCKIEYARYISGNVTTEGGNAVFIRNFDKVRISNCLLQHNYGGRGAGIYCDRANIKINRNRIYDNATNQYGAGIYVVQCSPSITDNVIKNNYAGNNGGGIYFDNSQSSVLNNIVSNNSCYWTGAGIVLTNSDLLLLRNTIAFNESGHDDGGGLAIYSSSPKVVNNTICYNKAEKGEGVYIGNYSEPDFINTIIYANSDRYQDSNTDDEIYLSSESSEPNFYNCNIQGGIAGIVQEYGTYSGIVLNNIDSPPLFSDPLNGVFSITWKNFPSIDATKSPCIDAGKVDSPHDPDGSIADIGSYYFHQQGKHFEPRAIFSADTLLGFNELAVQFSDLSDKGSGKIIKWEWDFGDNSISGEQHPIHVFSTGIFDVSLKVTDENNLSSTHKLPTPIIVDSGILVSSGEVSGRWAGNQKYLINGDIVIPKGRALEIEPGVSVIFYGPYKISVLGQLLAEGEKDNPIHFDVKDSTEFHNTEIYNSSVGGWAGIKFDAPHDANDSSKLIYCVIQHAKSPTGGAIHTGHVSELEITNCVIKNNFAYGGGGAGIYCASSCLIQQNVISHNKTGAYGEGAGIYVGGGRPRIINNFIMNNEAQADGGGISCHWGGSQPFIFGNVISNNKGFRGGGISAFYGTMQVINNTIIGNEGVGGAGGIFMLYSNYNVVKNNIIYDNNGLQIGVDDSYSKPTLEYNLIQYGINGVGPNNDTYSATNFDADPKFNLSPNAKGKIREASPSINAGSPEDLNDKGADFDIIGNPRVKDGRIDIGAYEYVKGESPKILSNLGTVVLQQDFGSFIINLDTIFSYYLGIEWISFSIEYESGQNVVSSSVENNTLIVTSIDGSSGDVTIKVTASDGDSEVSDRLYIRVEKNVVTGVENEAPQEVVIYPNPVSSVLKIRIKADYLQLRMIGPSGKVAIEKQFESYAEEREINLKDLPSGQYILEIIPDERRYYKKIIKE